MIFVFGLCLGVITTNVDAFGLGSCDPRQFYKSFPGDTSKFYECVALKDDGWGIEIGEWKAASCELGEDFVESKQKCLKRSRVRKQQSLCGINPTSPVCESFQPCSASNINPAAGGACSWQTASLARNPVAQDSFLQCLPTEIGQTCGNWQVQQCAPQNQFNLDVQMCVRPELPNTCGPVAQPVCGCNSNGGCPAASSCNQGSCCQPTSFVAPPPPPMPMPIHIPFPEPAPPCPCGPPAAPSCGSSCEAPNTCFQNSCCPPCDGGSAQGQLFAPQPISSFSQPLTMQVSSGGPCPCDVQPVAPCDIGCGSPNTCVEQSCCPPCPSVQVPPPQPMPIALPQNPCPCGQPPVAQTCGQDLCGAPNSCVQDQCCPPCGSSQPQLPTPQIILPPPQPVVQHVSQPECPCGGPPVAPQCGGSCEQPNTCHQPTQQCCPPCGGGPPPPLPLPQPMLPPPQPSCPCGHPPVSSNCASGCAYPNECIQNSCCPPCSAPSQFQPMQQQQHQSYLPENELITSVAVMCPSGIATQMPCQLGCPEQTSCYHGGCCHEPQHTFSANFEIVPEPVQPMFQNIVQQHQQQHQQQQQFFGSCPTGQVTTTACGVDNSCGGQQQCFQGGCCPSSQVPQPAFNCPNGETTQMPCDLGCPEQRQCYNGGCCPLPVPPQPQPQPIIQQQVEQFYACPDGQFTSLPCGDSKCPQPSQCYHGGCCSMPDMSLPAPIIQPMPQPMPTVQVCQTSGVAPLSACGPSAPSCPSGYSCQTGAGCCPESQPSIFPDQFSQPFMPPMPIVQPQPCPGSGVAPIGSCGPSQPGCPSGYSCQSGGGCCLDSGIQSQCPSHQLPVCQCASGNNACPAQSTCGGAGACCSDAAPMLIVQQPSQPQFMPQQQQFMPQPVQFPGGPCQQTSHCSGGITGHAVCADNSCQCTSGSISNGAACVPQSYLPQASLSWSPRTCCSQFASPCALVFSAVKRKPVRAPVKAIFQADRYQGDNSTELEEPVFFRPLNVSRRCNNDCTCTAEEICVEHKCIRRMLPGEYGCVHDRQCNYDCTSAYCDTQSGQCRCGSGGKAFILTGTCFNKCPSGTAETFDGRCKVTNRSEEFWSNAEMLKSLDTTHTCGPIPVRDCSESSSTDSAQVTTTSTKRHPKRVTKH